MKTTLDIFLLGMTLLWCTCLTWQDVQLRETIISLQTDNATQTQELRQLRKDFDEYPFEHAKILSDVDLIGGSVFTNWEMASDLYAKRGK